jgi:hypothetical protein
MQYPDKLLRGIPARDCIDGEGRATISLFQFKENSLRSDGKSESSINWYDTEEAFDILKHQKRYRRITV